MIAFRNILTRVAAKVWKDGKDKIKRKLENLERRWRDKPRAEVEGLWRGVRIGDKELEEEMANEVEEAPKAIHKYGGATSSADEDSVLALPHKFTVFESIQMDKIKVSTEILKDKIRWELRSREEKEEAPWTEEWELEQQDEKEVFRPEEGKMEFSRRRVTDMPTNRFVHIPNPAGPEVETVLDNISSRVNSVVKAFIREKCDQKGNIHEKNLSQQQQRGLKSLAKRVKLKELVVQKTDKGGDLAINTPENYIETMRPHFETDPDLTWENHEKLEAELNACTIQFARVLRVGAKWGHWPRVKSAVTSHLGPIPLLSGYPKTHKDISHLDEDDRLKGPPVRPVCGASESNNGPLSDLLSQICMQLGDEMDKSLHTLCLSQEEMCGGMEKVNNREGITKLVVFSMDVSKMFPSLIASDVAKLVKEEYLRANLEVEVDDKELGLMLAILLSREEVKGAGLGLQEEEERSSDLDHHQVDHRRKRWTSRKSLPRSRTKSNTCRKEANAGDAVRSADQEGHGQPRLLLQRHQQVAAGRWTNWLKTEWRHRQGCNAELEQEVLGDNFYSTEQLRQLRPLLVALLRRRHHGRHRGVGTWLQIRQGGGEGEGGGGGDRS